MLELREEVKWHLSFTDEEVFQGVALIEKEEESPKILATADVSKVPHVPEPPLEERAPKFLGWEKVLHPSQPVVATREIPQPMKTSRPRVESSQPSSMIPIKPPVSLPRIHTPPKPSLLPKALVLVQPPTLPCGFSGVTACLRMPELVEVNLEPPIGTMPIGLVATLGISSMSASHIVRDEVTGVTYLDTITTSIGRVALSSPDLEAPSSGPTIEDITGHE